VRENFEKMKSGNTSGNEEWFGVFVSNLKTGSGLKRSGYDIKYPDFKRYLIEIN